MVLMLHRKGSYTPTRIAYLLKMTVTDVRKIISQTTTQDP